MDKKKTLTKNKEIKILISVFTLVLLTTFLATSYAAFTYSRTSASNTIETGLIEFSFSEGSGDIEKGNVFPIEESDIDNTITRTFSITANSNYSEGIRYRVYVVYGDSVSGKTRLRDDVISFEFTPPTDGNGFTNYTNNCQVPASVTMVNGKGLIAAGVIKNTSASTTKSYTLKMFIDSNKINVSSTTKRKTIAEGNPTYAEPAEGTTTATRYMRNNTSEGTTITLYPAITSQEGKIIYTTNEFSNSYYSFKILVEAEEILGPICRRVTEEADLHSEACTNTDTSYYCQADGYELNEVIKYGNAKAMGSALATGDAFDCDVNGNGIIDKSNGVSTERFYYISNYWNPGTNANDFDTSTGVLIYYTNYLNGSSSYSGAAYITTAATKGLGYTCTETNGCNSHGPVTSAPNLPTIAQWSNVNLKTTTRNIMACSNQNCSAAPVATTGNGVNTITNPFSYGGKAARLLSLPELVKACKGTINNNVSLGTVGSLKACNFLFEGTKYTNTSRGTYGPSLETPYSPNSVSVWFAYGYNRRVNTSNSATVRGARPVIEVPYALMEY